MDNDKRNVDAESKLVSGIIRSIPAFLIGGPAGLIYNGLYTTYNVKNEIKKEEERVAARSAMLNNRNEVKAVCPTREETQRFFKDYANIFHPLKMTRLSKLIKTPGGSLLSETNNKITRCRISFETINDADAYIVCKYDFWKIYYNTEGNMQLFKFRYGKEYMGFTTDSCNSFYICSL